MGIERLGVTVRKELVQFLRDPVLLALVLWLYTVEVVLCTVALTFELRDEAVAVLDLDRSPESRALAESLDRSPSFAVRFRPPDGEAAARLLGEGRARLLVVVPPGYARALGGAAEPVVQLLADGTNSVVATTALGVARRQLARTLREASPPGLPLPGRAPPVLENRVRIWYNPGLRFSYFVVVSMIALAAYMVGVIHPAATIVKEKERGTIEQLLVSPLGTGELIAAKTVPTFLVGLVALGPSLLVARAFGVPFRGDPLAFLLLSAVFLASAIGTGVLIGSLVRTLQQALLVSFFVLFPVMFLSGTLTPIESMPGVLRELSRLSPLRYYLEGLLGVFLKGVGLRVLWPQLLWMGALGVVLFGGSALVFRRRLA